MQPLDELIREVLRAERTYAVQGNEWYGWWAGRVPDGRQVFAVVDCGLAAYDQPDPAARVSQLYLAIFEATGGLIEIQVRSSPLRIDPHAASPRGDGPSFDVAELEAHLAAEFGGFEGATIRVQPFAIDDVGLELHPLHSAQERFLDDPDDFDEVKREAIRAWIDEGCSELLYNNDFFLDGDGDASS